MCPRKNQEKIFRLINIFTKTSLQRNLCCRLYVARTGFFAHYLRFGIVKRKKYTCVLGLVGFASILYEKNSEDQTPRRKSIGGYVWNDLSLKLCILYLKFSFLLFYDSN